MGRVCPQRSKGSGGVLCFFSWRQVRFLKEKRVRGREEKAKKPAHEGRNAKLRKARGEAPRL